MSLPLVTNDRIPSALVYFRRNYFTFIFQNCCQPNALMTLKEYLTDYASPATKEVGEKLILKELEQIPNENVRAIVIDHLRAIEEENRRDFRF